MERIHVGFEKATKAGFFDKAWTSTPVVVGPGLLPKAVPASNVRAATRAHLVDLVKHGAHRDSLQQHQLRVAQAAAAEFGLEIKVKFQRGPGFERVAFH